MDIQPISKWTDEEQLKYIYKVPQVLWQNVSPVVALVYSIAQYKIWEANIPKTFRKYFHLWATRLPTIQKVDEMAKPMFRISDFKLPFAPSCWSYIYRATRTQLEEDSKLPSIYFAVKYGHQTWIPRLVKSGSNVNIRNNANETPLHIAADLGNVEMIETLVWMGADPNACSYLSDTPLHYAVDRGNSECLLSILDSPTEV